MSSNKISEITKLLTMSLTENDVAFMYLGYSAIILRTVNGAIIIDPASLVSSDEAKALSNIETAPVYQDLFDILHKILLRFFRGHLARKHRVKK